MKTYEGMFLVDAGQANFEAACVPIKKNLDRTGGEILSIKPWDERKLAYEVAGRKRGLYILTYFKLDPLKVTEFEHECKLDEGIIRVMLIRKDKISDEQINTETPAMQSSRRTEEIEAARAKAIAETQEAAEAEAKTTEDAASTDAPAEDAASEESTDTEAVEPAPAEDTSDEAVAAPAEDVVEDVVEDSPNNDKEEK